MCQYVAMETESTVTQIPWEWREWERGRGREGERKREERRRERDEGRREGREERERKRYLQLHTVCCDSYHK